jgi:leucyl-tRNA synthetase
MFLGPFQEGGDFRDAGINGIRRFLDKVWQLVVQAASEGERGGELHHAVVLKWHQTKKKVTGDLETLSYNTAIAAMMEMLNTIRESNVHEHHLVEELVVMLAPFAPHFAEECWERLGHAESVFDARWPAYDPALLVDDVAEVVVQVNGKTRSRVRVMRDALEGVVVGAAKADPQVAKFLDGKELAKVVYVPNRLLNLVVK